MIRLRRGGPVLRGRPYLLESRGGLIYPERGTVRERLDRIEGLVITCLVLGIGNAMLAAVVVLLVA
jgi:hypothetical protein